MNNKPIGGRRRRRKSDKPNPIDVHVGTRVRLRRTLLGMSQEKLGDALGLTFQQVQKYERGANRIGASRLYDLSHVLDVPVSFFFDDIKAETVEAAQGDPSRREPGNGGYEPDPMMRRETLELVRAYYRIPDMQIRRRLFDLTKAATTPDAGGRRFLKMLDGAVAACHTSPRALTREKAGAVLPEMRSSIPAWRLPNPGGRGKGSRTVAKRDYVFASESVSEGHPDKVCDRISDVVVDAFLAADPQARVACETLATTNRVVLAGEVRGPDAVTKELLIEAARHAIKDIGYEQEGFHWRHAEISCYLHKQSGDIAQGVDAGGNKDEGAGDQGIMFGYACRETPELMPAPIYYAHAILKSLAEARHSGAAPLLGPDAKSQVSLQYVNGNPVRATSVVVSTQHAQS